MRRSLHIVEWIEGYGGFVHTERNEIEREQLFSVSFIDVSHHSLVRTEPFITLKSQI